VPVELYRSKVMPEMFHKAWDNPELLYSVIAGVMREGFFEEALDPAAHLVQIDSDRVRSTNVLGVALMQTGDLDGAEALFKDHLRDAGPAAIIMTNLAKIYSTRGDAALAEQTLWTALTIDPNYENGLVWWGALHREREDEPGFLEAMRQVAELPGSWRAQLWLARKLLEDDKLAEALDIYRAVLPDASEDPNALTMISGDLCKNRHVREGYDLVAPLYDPAKHGLIAGVNLLQACIELGEKQQGRELLATLRRLKRYDLSKILDKLEEQLR